MPFLLDSVPLSDGVALTELKLPAIEAPASPLHPGNRRSEVMLTQYTAYGLLKELADEFPKLWPDRNISMYWLGAVKRFRLYWSIPEKRLDYKGQTWDCMVYHEAILDQIDSHTFKFRANSIYENLRTGEKTYPMRIDPVELSAISIDHLLVDDIKRKIKQSVQNFANADPHDLPSLATLKYEKQLIAATAAG